MPVGLTSQNIVDTPPNNVGWYDLGVRPGEVGAANLDGHATGAFDNLHNLQTGNDIYTVDALGQQFHFKVLEKELVDISSFPIQKVYGAINRVRLNLVTCAGSFNPADNDFTQRVIIYSDR